MQSGIYNEFLKKFTAHTQALKLGDPFEAATYQGPQVSQIQYDVRDIDLLSIHLYFIRIYSLICVASHGLH